MIDAFANTILNNKNIFFWLFPVCLIPYLLVVLFIEDIKRYKHNLHNFVDVVKENLDAHGKYKKRRVECGLVERFDGETNWLVPNLSVYFLVPKKVPLSTRVLYYLRARVSIGNYKVTRTGNYFGRVNRMILRHHLDRLSAIADHIERTCINL